MPKDGFGAAFINPLLLWKLVFQHLMIPYGLFLIPALMAERQAILKPFRLKPDSFAVYAVVSTVYFFP